MTDGTTLGPADLSALVGSRICHDLISPLGAIGNGVELVHMTGAGAGGAEMALITESLESASARIRFFRVAFGPAEPGQAMARADIAPVLDDMSRAGRVAVNWRPAGEVPRQVVKLAFLLIQCFESAMPFGGAVQVTEDAGRWHLLGTSRRLRADAEVWGLLAAAPGQARVTAAQVHFALVPELLRRTGLKLTTRMGEDRIEVTF